MTLPVLTLSLAAVFATIDVRGDGSCPTPAEVEAALESFGHQQRGRHSPNVAELKETPEGFRLTLRSSAGDLLATREMHTRAECAQRGISVAVVLAAWESELAAAQQQASVLPPPPVWEWRFGAEAAVGVTHHSGVRLLPMAAVLGQMWLGDPRWGWLGRIGSSWPSRSPLGSAELVWMQPLLSLEAGAWMHLLQLNGAIQLELLGGMAALRLWGDGFAEDGSSMGLDGSISPGLRWIIGSGAVRPELSVNATFWLIPQRVGVEGSDQTRVLPQWQLRASAGFLWGR